MSNKRDEFGSAHKSAVIKSNPELQTVCFQAVSLVNGRQLKEVSANQFEG